MNIARQVGVDNIPTAHRSIELCTVPEIRFDHLCIVGRWLAN
jgi:hypothetical protein